MPGSRFTIVVGTADPIVYSYNPQENQIVSFKIPRDTQVETAGGYGAWSAGSLWQLGIQEGKGGRILANSIQKTLGVPIDGYISGRGQTLLEGSMFPFLFDGFLTNLTFFDRLNLIVAIGKVGRFSRTELDLVDVGVLKKTILPDGKEGFIAISEKAPMVFDILHDESIFAEGKTLRIVNAAGVSGVGTQASRTATILGLRVIGVDTGSQEVDGVCQARVGGRDRGTLSFRRVIQVFGCQEVDQAPSGPASIEIILGKEFGKDH